MLSFRVRRSCIAALFALLAILILVFSSPRNACAQELSGTIQGTVVDPSDALVPNASVQIENPVSGYIRQTKSDANGAFVFTNIPFNPYHLTVSAQGFTTLVQDVGVRSSVPVILKLGLTVSGATTSVTVAATAEDLLEETSEDHSDVSRELFDRLPLESQSSTVSSLITLATPGVVADSNGFFHGLGDHSSNSFSVDGQPITDQQSKIFSNQIPEDAIQSIEVLEGAPPAEYGDKTSLVIKATTRTGLGQTTPHGEVLADYGTFGSANLTMNVAFGTQKWGDFISLGGLNTGRFLDTPEVAVLHAHGNEENAFDRMDFKTSDKDSIQLNLQFARSWYQNPNTWDQQLQTCTALSADCNAKGTVQVNPLTGNPLGPVDQRAQLRTFNVAPTWTRLVNANTVLTAQAFLRHDEVQYFPSPNPFNDLGPLQGETLRQFRTLTNAGGRTDVSYVKGVHNMKAGVIFQHTFLVEKDSFGIVDPGLLPAQGCPDPTIPVCATLASYDLTNPATDPNGNLYTFHHHTDIKEVALYAQDIITKGPWSVSLGLRGDFYNGYTATRQAEPRGGLAYNIKKTNTVLRASYARTLETPFNENLILSSTGCDYPVVAAVMRLAQGIDCLTNPLAPGFRNEFHAGLQQAFGKYLVVSGEYIWKYTHGGLDINLLGSSPVFFPISWHNSKIPGYAIKFTVPQTHGFTAFVVMSHVNARFFPPTAGGIFPPQPPGVFRIDHDEQFDQTAHLEYQPFKRGPWIGFNWRYDSGLVAGQTPCFGDNCAQSDTLNGQPAIALALNDGVTPLTADQEFEAGLTCNGKGASPTIPVPASGMGDSTGLPVCLASQFGSTLLQVPAAGTENDDHHPPRVASRNLFDLAIGDDDLFHRSERYKWSARLSVVNLTNTIGLYNFLSTFSGTHYVTPRTISGEIGFHF